MSEEKNIPDWREVINGKLEYYLDSEEGRSKLSKMLRLEDERIRDFIGQNRQNIRDIVWFSKHCERCSWFVQKNRRMKCVKMKARIIKPFYGRLEWETVTLPNGIKEQRVSKIDWNSKKADFSDEFIERAIEKINHGMPYECYQSKSDK